MDPWKFEGVKMLEDVGMVVPIITVTKGAPFRQRQGINDGMQP